MDWNPGYDVDALLRRLHLLRHSPGSELYMTVIISAARLDETIPEPERLAIVRRSVASVLDQPNLNSQLLRSALAREEAAYLKRPAEEMTLLTSLSLMPETRLRQRTIGDSTILFSRSLPKTFNSPWLKEKAALHEVADHPKSYVKVRVVLAARSTREAMERGFFNLDVLRGIWNFGLGFRKYRMTLVGVGNKPFNSILLGPRFSVHARDGKLVEKELGSIDSFHEVSPVSETAATRVLATWERRIRRKLSAIGHRKKIEEAFVRYARAMDERDQSACLLGLWSLIERLTGTLNAKYEVTIRRSANIFTSPEPHRSVLQHLREHRNGIAHSGRESELGELLISQAKHFVEELLDFHLTQGRHFENFEEACQFLEFPGDREHLKRQIDLRRLALNLRARGERKGS